MNIFPIYRIVQARKVTKTAMIILNDILDLLLAYQVTGQEPQVLTTDRMSASVRKMDTKDLAGSSYSLGAGTFVLPTSEDIVGSWADKDCYIAAKVLDITKSKCVIDFDVRKPA